MTVFEQLQPIDFEFFVQIDMRGAQASVVFDIDKPAPDDETPALIVGGLHPSQERGV